MNLSRHARSLETRLFCVFFFCCCSFLFFSFLFFRLSVLSSLTLLFFLHYLYVCLSLPPTLSFAWIFLTWTYWGAWISSWFLFYLLTVDPYLSPWYDLRGSLGVEQQLSICLSNLSPVYPSLSLIAVDPSLTLTIVFFFNSYQLILLWVLPVYPSLSLTSSSFFNSYQLILLYLLYHSLSLIS